MKRFELPYLIDDPYTTPAGLVVPGKSIEPLVKAEAQKREAERNKAAFFSRFALYQNMSAFGAREKPIDTPSFDILYEASKKSFADAILIRSCVDQQKKIWQRALDDKSLGFKVVHDRYKDPTFKGSKEVDTQCREMESLINNPTPVDYIDIYPENVRPHNNLKDLMSRLVKAELIIDRKVILRYRRNDGKGYAAFHWLPGKTIKNVDEAVRQWAQNNEKSGKIDRNTVERMSFATDIDIAKCAYVQMFDGQITAGFTDDEIAVHISNPSDEENRWGYGTSRLELSLDVTSTLLYAWNYNRELFKTNWPDTLVTVSGDYDAEGFAAFKQQLTAQVGQGGWNRMPFINSNAEGGGGADSFKIEAHKLRDTPKDMLFDNMVRMMCMFKAAAYGAPPNTLNLSMDSGGGASLFGHNPSSEIEFSKDLWLLPSVTDTCDWLTDSIIKPRYPDLRLIVVGMEPDDEKAAVELRSARAKAWRTRNEARMEENAEPIGDVNDPLNPWNMPADDPLANQMNIISMLQNGGTDGGDEPDDETPDADAPKSKPGKSEDGGEIKKSEKSTSEVKFLKITWE